MAVTPQIKANQLAKDLNIKSKDMVDIMSSRGLELKAQKALEPAEFAVLFDAITSMHQVEGIDDYIDGLTFIPSKLETSEKVAASITNNVTRAEAYRDTVIPSMKLLREFVDEMETLTSSEYWPLPGYGDMMFKV